MTMAAPAQNNIKVKDGFLEMGRNLTSTSRYSLLVFLVAAKQYKDWKARNTDKDAKHDFPGFDLDKIAADLQPILGRTLRVHGKFSEVLQHLFRLDHFKLVAFRFEASTVEKPKFSLSEKGERLYDAVETLGYSEYLLSKQSEPYWYALVTRAAHQLLGNPWVRAEDFQTCTALSPSQVQASWRLFKQGFVAYTQQGQKFDFKFATVEEERNGFLYRKLDPKEMFSGQEVGDIDFGAMTAVPVPTPAPTPVPDKQESSLRETILLSLEGSPKTKADLVEVIVRHGFGKDKDDADFMLGGALDSLLSKRTIISDDDGNLYYLASKVASQPKVWDEPEVPVSALPTKTRGIVFTPDEVEAELLEWEAKDTGLPTGAILQAHYNRLFSDIATRRREKQRKAKIEALEIEETAALLLKQEAEKKLAEIAERRKRAASDQD